MGTWKTRGLRGSGFEELINYTNESYRHAGLALIQKIPTPITPMQIDRESRHITLAYFERKSTVDYIGAVQGIPVCFDAKECSTDTFSLANIHEHQMEFMEEFEAQEGISFFLLQYTKREEMYLVPFEEVLEFWKDMQEGGRKSIPYEKMCREYPIRREREALVHYLEALGKYLECREKNEKKTSKIY